MTARVLVLALAALAVPLSAEAQSFVGQGAPRTMEMPKAAPVQPVAPRAEPAEDKPFSQMSDAEFERWREDNRWFWDKSGKDFGLDPRNPEDVRFCREYQDSLARARDLTERTERYDPMSENSCEKAGLPSGG